MPEPLSTAVVAGYTFALYCASRTSSAVSPEARTIRDSLCAVVRDAERSEALFGAKERAISDLFAVVSDCARADWNGEGASPIYFATGRRAADFVRALPEGVPLPEFAPEPDGSISMDWIQSRSRVFSLSIGTTDRIAYAWIDGTDRGHAVARFESNVVPRRILAGIRDIVNAAAFRAA